MKLFKLLLRGVEFLVMFGLCLVTALIQTVYEKFEMHRIKRKGIVKAQNDS